MVRSQENAFASFCAKLGFRFTRRTNPNTTTKSAKIMELFALACCKFNWRLWRKLLWKRVGYLYGMIECIGPKLDIKISTCEESLTRISKGSVSTLNRTILS